MNKNSKSGYYVAYSIIVLFVIAVIGGIVEAYNSHVQLLMPLPLITTGLRGQGLSKKIKLTL